MQNKNRSRTLHLTTLAMLGAIIIIMTFTPLGYFKSGPLSITFLTIPVILGAIALGPFEGGILGALFGITSFSQCFGLDAFGSTLLGINPVYTFIMCMIPRILIGVISGYLFRLFEKLNINQVLSYTLASLAGALTNTVFFVGFLLILFGNTDFIRSFGENIFKIISVLVTVNSVVEAVVCTIFGSVLAKGLGVAIKRMSVSGNKVYN